MDWSDEAPNSILEIFDRGSNCSADAGGRAVLDVGVNPLDFWDRGFESW